MPIDSLVMEDKAIYSAMQLYEEAWDPPVPSHSLDRLSWWDSPTETAVPEASRKPVSCSMIDKQPIQQPICDSHAPELEVKCVATADGRGMVAMVSSEIYRSAMVEVGFIEPLMKSCQLRAIRRLKQKLVDDADVLDALDPLSPTAVTRGSGRHGIAP